MSRPKPCKPWLSACSPRRPALPRLGPFFMLQDSTGWRRNSLFHPSGPLERECRKAMALLRTASPSDLGPVIESEHVMLRTPQMSDFPAWAELRAASREFLTPWEPLSASDELSRASFRRRGVTQSCTLGYWIGAKYAQQGYMTAAIRAVTPFVFDSLELHRLDAACLPSNAASIKLLEKTGFKREGLARRYLRINGVWQDHLLYALLDTDTRR